MFRIWFVSYIFQNLYYGGHGKVCKQAGTQCAWIFYIKHILNVCTYIFCWQSVEELQFKLPIATFCVLNINHYDQYHFSENCKNIYLQWSKAKPLFSNLIDIHIIKYRIIKIIWRFLLFQQLRNFFEKTKYFKRIWTLQENL